MSNGYYDGIRVVVKKFKETKRLSKYQENEWQMLSDMNHPCIVSFYGYFQDKHEELCIVMEYMKCDLEQKTADPNQDGFSFLKALHSIASGLEYMHEHNVMIVIWNLLILTLVHE